MRVDPGSSTSANINLIQPRVNGDCLNAEYHPPSGYRCDFLVLEYAGAEPVWTQASAADWNFARRYKDGCHLWVPENLPSPNGDDSGHDVWTHVPQDGGAQMRGYYCLDSDYSVGRGTSAKIVVVDPMLSEKIATTAPGTAQIQRNDPASLRSWMVERSEATSPGI